MKISALSQVSGRKEKLGCQAELTATLQELVDVLHLLESLLRCGVDLGNSFRSIVIRSNWSREMVCYLIELIILQRMTPFSRNLKNPGPVPQSIPTRDSIHSASIFFFLGGANDRHRRGRTANPLLRISARHGVRSVN